MPALYTKEILQNKDNAIFSISYQLDSNFIPYSMHENFIIMEKIPDYLFAYFNKIFSNQNLETQYTLSFTQKSVDDDKTEVTLKTNNLLFF